MHKAIKTIKKLINNRRFIFISLTTFTIISIAFVIASLSAPTFKKSKDPSHLYSAENKLFNLKVGNSQNQPEIDFSVKDKGLSFQLTGIKSASDPKVSGKKITYNEILPNIDLVYTTKTNGVKEEIVIKKKVQEIPSSFIFDLNFHGATLGNIHKENLEPVFFDQDGRYLFHFEEPFAVDAKGNKTHDVKLEIGQDKQTGAYFLKLTTDQTWLQDPARTYPVTIDPTIVHDESSEYATGTFNRNKDLGSGSSPQIASYYQESVADENTVGLWHMNETSGTNVADSSSSGYNGTASNTAIVTSFLNMARSFNGTTSYINTNTDLSWTTTDSFTIELWLNPATVTGQMGIIGKGEAGGYGASNWEWSLRSDGGIVSFVYFNTSGAGEIYLDDPLPMNINDWHHYAVTYDGVAKKAHLFRNGILIDTDDIVVNTFQNRTTPALIGHSYFTSGTNYYFNGILDEVRISNIARSIEDIKTTATRRPYSVFTSPTLDLGSQSTLSWTSFTWNELGVATGDGETAQSTTGLIAQWNLNEVSGTTAANNTGSCGATCNGTLTSFASTSSQDQAIKTGWTSENKRWGAGALMFDGVDDHVNAGTSANLKFTGDFSLEAWVKPSGTTVGQIISSGATGDWLYYLGNGNGNSPTCKIYQANSGNGYLQVNANKPVADGNWHHVVCTLSGNTLSIYIDGFLDGVTSTTTGTRDTSSAGSFYIGRFTNTTSSYYAGTIDVVRAYSRAITSAEVVSNYNASNLELQTRVGDTSDPNDGSWEEWRPTNLETLLSSLDQTPDNTPISYWPLDERSGTSASDQRSTYHGTATNTTISDGKYKLGRSFAGAGYIEIPHNSALAITGNFTLSAWVNKNTGANRQIISKTGAGGTGGYSLLTGSNGEVYCRTDNGTTWTDSYTGTGWVTSSTGWTHVAAVKSGTQCRIYINGVERTTNYGTHTTTTANTLPLVIGARADKTTEFWSGHIDDVRIYNQALSATQVTTLTNTFPTNLLQHNLTIDTALKNEGSGSLRFNTSKTQADKNTVGLWKLDETSGSGAFIKDSSGNNNSGTPTGTTSTKGINGQARVFNGTSNFIQVPAGAGTSLDIDSNAITLEAWIKTNTLTGTQQIISRGTRGTEGYGLAINYSSGYANVGLHGGGNFNSTVAIQAGKWYHIAGVINGTSSAIYINGQLAANGTTVNVIASNLDLRIGAGWNGSSVTEFFNGEIDEVRVSNIARSGEEIAESYRMSSNHYQNYNFTNTNLSTQSSLPFYIAADRPGSYLTTIVGESSYANYQPDSNTLGLWHLDEIDSGSSLPTYFDYDSFEGGIGSVDDWQMRNYIDPVPTNLTAFTGEYSLHMEAGWGRNFESGTGEPTSYPYDTNTYPYMCMAYKIPSGTINNMLINIDGVGWRSITMTQGESPTSYAKVASWNPLTTDNTWQHKCINLDSQLDTSIGTGTHNINAVIWHDGGGSPSITGEFWIDDFIISSTIHYPHQNPAADATGRINNLLPYSLISASGGTTSSANGFTIHTFNSSGTFTVNSGTNKVETLLVAGGGGGGGAGSGGGAGGVVYSNNSVSPQAYTVTVGTGGAGGIDAANGSKGGNTTFNSLTAEGGGLGVTHGTTAGGNGGSGGGGAIRTAAPTSTGGTGSQGSAGGAGYVESGWIGNSGGGGGAYTTGTAGGNTAGSGNGGVGRQFSLIGSSAWYAGGGGGGEIHGSYVGAGGTGGGGSANVDGNGNNGTSNTGGGGAGGSYGYNGSAWDYYNGGTGGSGIAIIRYPTTKESTKSNLVGTTSIKGKIGQGRQFNGTSEFITIGTTQQYFSPGTSTDATIETWFSTKTLDNTDRRLLTLTASGSSLLSLRQTDTNQIIFHYRDGANAHILLNSNFTPALNTWYHVAGVKQGTSVKIYINGQLMASANDARSQIMLTSETDSNAYIGAFSPTGYFWSGALDEVRISSVARTAEEIRQAYEVASRSHQITIDFAAKLSSGNLITGSGDLGFSIDATIYGLKNPGSMLFVGDKIIIRENIDGIEYLAQGTVNSIAESTGATTVSSWDAGSTFPTGGYTAQADVFKWQREYFSLTGIAPSSHIDAANLFSLRLTDGGEGRTIWIDDLRSSDDYLTNPAGSSITSSNGLRYFQYRAILHSSNEYVSPALTSTSLNYELNNPPNTPALNNPTSGATHVSTTPTLQTTTTDPNSDYLRYKIEVCKDLAMTTSCQTYDQTTSQTGWSGQNTQTSSAYTSGTQGSYTVQSALDAGTLYYWRSYAIDPGGSNTWSATQITPNSFTTNFAPIAPSALQTEGATNPTQVYDLTPEFSAIYSDPESDQATHYEIEVNTASNFSGTVLWDSGQQSTTAITSGNRSTDISYAGTTLTIDENTYYWRIRFWDSLGAVGAWSSAGEFTMSAAPTKPNACVIEEALDDGALLVKWTDATTNELGFELRRSVNGGAFSLLQTLAADTTSYNDTTISQGNTYAYQIAAYVSGPIYGDWCTTKTLELQDGTFNLQGVSLQGVSLQ